MEATQYLVLAREITQNESGVFTYYDVSQHLFIDRLPAKGEFDVAIVCGPGWEPGEHHLHIAMKMEEHEPKKIGYAKVHIKDQFHIFTVKLEKIILTLNTENPFYFMVYRHSGEFIENDDTIDMITGELIIERPFKVTKVTKKEEVTN